jgi:hypothetical protein
MHRYTSIYLSKDAFDPGTIAVVGEDDSVCVDFRSDPIGPSSFRRVDTAIALSRAHAEHLYAELGKVLGKIPMAQEIS